MTIEEDRAKYFWLAANDPVDVNAGFPEPPTFPDSKITPLIDMSSYMAEFEAAINQVGVSTNASDNVGDFLFITGWWLGLNGGEITIPQNAAALAAGPTIASRAPFSLDPVDVTKKHLRDILKLKQKRGVDVRVLGWASPSVLMQPPPTVLPLAQNQALAVSVQNNVASFVNANAETIDAIQFLRDTPNPVPNAMMNVMAHSAGAAHMKFALVGKANGEVNGTPVFKAVGFTGGLDFEMFRWARPGHDPDGAWDSAHEKQTWHDIQAKIEGPALQALYDHFVRSWAENIAHPVLSFAVDGNVTDHRTPSINAVTPRIISAPLDNGVTGLDHHVQSLTTSPDANYAAANNFPQGRQVAFAPGGRFEIRAAWRKAISAAERYIYIEDQAFWSAEVMSWIRERLRVAPNLRVILVAPGAGDPNDGNANFGDLMFVALNQGLLGQGLAPAVQPLGPNEAARIRMFQLWGEMDLNDVAMEVDSVDSSPSGFDAITLKNLTGRNFRANEMQNVHHFFEADVTPDTWRIIGNPAMTAGVETVVHVAKNPTKPSPGDTIFGRQALGITVHSKVTLIDDKWALIGSANVTQRSLYTDWEHAVSFLDADTTAPNAIARFRMALWNEHFNNPGVAGFENIDDAITAWDPFDLNWRLVPVPVLTPEPPPRPAAEAFAPPYIQPLPLPFPPPPAPLTIPPAADRQMQIDKFIDVDSRNIWGGQLIP